MTTIAELSAIENESIAAFVAAQIWTGRVLDYGCGRQPYRQIIERAGAEYVPWDRKSQGGGSVGDYGPDNPLRDGIYDAILCTQVVEYVPGPPSLFERFNAALRRDGKLVMTYPTVWPELPYDLHRFTKLGMERLLVNAGFTVESHECRATVPGVEVRLPVGYGVVATPC